MILKPSTGVFNLDNQMIYRSSIVCVDGAYHIYYSAMNHRQAWHTFLVNFDPSVAIAVVNNPKKDSGQWLPGKDKTAFLNGSSLR